MDANTPTRIAGRNIRRLRLRAGLSQAAVAGAAGIGQTYIGQLERAEKNVSLQVLANVAAALGVTAADLLQPDPEASAPPRTQDLRAAR